MYPLFRNSTMTTMGKSEIESNFNMTDVLILSQKNSLTVPEPNQN